MTNGKKRRIGKLTTVPYVNRTNLSLISILGGLSQMGIGDLFGYWVVFGYYLTYGTVPHLSISLRSGST